MTTVDIDPVYLEYVKKKYEKGNLTQADVKLILSKGAELKESGFLGGTVLINRRTTFVLRLLPKSWLLVIERLIVSIPIINRLTCHGLYAVLEKSDVSAK